MIDPHSVIVPNARDLVQNLCTPEQRLIMALLSAPRARSAWGEPALLAATVSWSRFLEDSDDLLKPYSHWASQRAPFAGMIPSAIAEDLAFARRAAGMRNLRWATELRRMVESFKAERLSLMLVKGSALQRTVYPDPSTRPMGDADLIVRREEMERAGAIMTRLGFQSRTSPEGHTPSAGLDADEEANFYKIIEGQVFYVEVHTRVELEIPAYSGPAPPLWMHCVNVPGSDGILVPTLSPHTALRHLCLHLGKHSFDHGLMWLLDIRLFVDKYGPLIQWDEFMRECESRTRPLIAFTLGLAADWLGADVPSSVSAALDSRKGSVAVALVWGQVWDYVRGRQPPVAIAVVLSAEPRRIWKYLRDHVRRWLAPISNGRSAPFVSLGERFWSGLKSLRAALREVDFSPSNLRRARRGDDRSNRLRTLLWPPLDS